MSTQFLIKVLMLGVLPVLAMIFGLVGHEVSSFISGITSVNETLVYSIIGPVFIAFHIAVMLAFLSARLVYIEKLDLNVHSLIAFLLMSISLFLFSLALFLLVPLNITEFLASVFYEKLPSSVENIFQDKYGFFERNLLVVERVLLVPIQEEIFFRGVLLSVLIVKLNKHLSVLVVSFFFSLVHYDMVSAFIFSAVMCYMTLCYRSIVPAIFLHCMYNAISVVWDAYEVEVFWLYYFDFSGWLNYYFFGYLYGHLEFGLFNLTLSILTIWAALFYLKHYGLSMTRISCSGFSRT